MIRILKITVVGTGYVGIVTSACLAEIGHNVICLDINKEKIDKLKKGDCPIYENGLKELLLKNCDKIIYTTDYILACETSDVIMICVETPNDRNGRANLTAINSAIKQITRLLNHDSVIIIKSTVPVGFNDIVEKYINERVKNDIQIKVVSNPEFLSQGTAIYDTLYASRIIIGADDNEAKEIMKKLYDPLTKSPYYVPIFVTSRKNAEMIKYASNCFLALKISYINELANLSEKIGANIMEITKGMSYDKRIGSNYLNAGIGYGGSCLPKDTTELYEFSKSMDCPMMMLNSAICINNSQKIKMIEKIKQDNKDLNQKEVAILGLAFKPGTDDIRDAPSIENTIALLHEGAKVKVYDPRAQNNFEKIFGKKIEYCNTINEAIENTDIVLITSELPEIKNYNLINYCNLMKEANVYDGRNCYSLSDVSNYGIFYSGIGIDYEREYILKKIDLIFENIISKYNLLEKNNKRKLSHMKRVAEYSYFTSNKLHLGYRNRILTYIISLFHDIGRFDENKIFGIIDDKNDFDHAEQSIKILFNCEEFLAFLEQYHLTSYIKIIKESIFYHNKLTIPAKKNNIFLKILRDSDKIDILDLVISGEIIPLNLDDIFSRKNISFIKNRRCISNENIKNNSDKILKYLSFIFDINYNFNLKYIYNEKIPRLYEKIDISSSKIINEQFNEIKKIIDKYVCEKQNDLQ